MKGMAMPVRANWKKLKIPKKATIGDRTAASTRTMNEAMRPTRTISRSVAPLWMIFL